MQTFKALPISIANIILILIVEWNFLPSNFFFGSTLWVTKIVSLRRMIITPNEILISIMQSQ